jgi:hypothetical protein
MKNFVVLSMVLCMVSYAGANIPASGLQLHLDASSLSGYNNGDTVQAWTDLSGNGNNATSTGTPTYITDALNGHAAVSIQGSLTLDGYSWTGNNDDWFSLASTVHNIKTITMVVKRTSNTYYSWAPIFGSEPTGWVNDAFAGDDVWGTAFCSSNYADPAVRYGDLSINGVSQGSAGWVGVPTDYSILTLTIQDGWGSDININQIASSINSSYVWGMDIAELLVYDRFLSGSELDSLTGSLGAKYNLVPEPMTMGLLGLGGLLILRRRKA